jgi:cytoplasmic iron level regulating protein YaaA (DUF328/UPF0246 family)
MLAGVLILLPPSEGKAAAGRGRPLDLAGLSLPALTPARERVVDALVALSADPVRARTVLGLSPGQTDEIARNATLRTAGVLPAGKLYTGVLYDALDLATLPEAGRRLANRTVLVASAVWGAVRLTDRIPPYRCAIGVNLPGVGGLTGYWKKVLPDVLAGSAGRGPVLDLRSAPYAAMWTPSGPAVTVRVLHERDGRRVVVSHFNKATKGRIVRSLLTAGGLPRTVAGLATALRDLKYTVEEAPGRLDVIVTEL